VTVLVLLLAGLWNLSPLAAAFAHSQSDPSARASYWRPAIHYLRLHLSPDYRVEVVDTIGHWEAVYMPEAGIPLARGWFRQDDFPQNAVLYGRLGSRTYVSWLRSLGIRYVVLTDAPPDYSAVAEAKLIRSGRLPLRRVFRSRHVTIYALASPRPLVTGPGHPRVVALRDTSMTVVVTRSGVYRLAVHASPYWQSSAGCVATGRDGMLRFHARRAGTVRLTFTLSARGAVQALTGTESSTCP
jgi:hypothetical protein